MRTFPSAAVICLVVAAAAAPSGAGAGAAEPAGGRELVIIGLSQEPDTLNPLFARRPVSAAVRAALFTVDVQRDQTGAPFPQGVLAIPTLRDGTWKVNGEAMTLAWTIRPRRWQDGTPVTCADYAFGHVLARDERVRVGSRDLTTRIAGVVCTRGDGGTRLTVTWKGRYPYANLSVTEYGALPRHLLQPLYQQDPAALSRTPYGRDPKATVTDGPYRLVEWRRGAALTVEASADHPIFGTPRIPRITWRFFRDPKALAASMRSGAIDAIGTIGISIDEGLELERQAGGRFTVFFGPALTWEHLDFNLDNPLLQDLRVRRAIAHGIHRDQIVRQLLADRLPVSHTYLPPRHPGHTNAVLRYPYDPPRARVLLKEAGFTPGPDGIARDAQGRRLALDLATTADNPLRAETAQMIRRHLREIGVEIRVRPYPARVYFGEILSRRRFAALAMYAWVLAPTSDCDQLYTSDSIPHEGNGWAGLNYPGYRNAEMDRLCRAATHDIDEARRARLLAETAQIFARDLPAVPLYVRASVAAAKTGLRNFLPVQIGTTYETWNVHSWAWSP